MSEPTLAGTYSELLTVASSEAGWGYSVPTDATKLARCQAFVYAGLRQFYFPNPMGGVAHHWSFLKPSATLYTWTSITAATVVTDAVYAAPSTTVGSVTSIFYPTMVGRAVTLGTTATTVYSYTSGTAIEATGDVHGTTSLSMTTDGNYRLPDDFGQIIGDLTYVNESIGNVIRVCGEQKIRELRQTDADYSGSPQYAAIVPAERSTITGQRWDLQLWPIPDDEYTLSYRYSVLPDTLSTVYYPYGGAAHFETIKASVCAVVERELNRESGIWANEFQVRLAASIAYDRRNESGYLGYNGDGSDVNACGRRDGATFVYYNNALE